MHACITQYSTNVKWIEHLPLNPKEKTMAKEQSAYDTLLGYALLGSVAKKVDDEHNNSLVALTPEEHAERHQRIVPTPYNFTKKKH
jgi:hypothetical protein